MKASRAALYGSAAVAGFTAKSHKQAIGRTAAIGVGAASYGAAKGHFQKGRKTAHG